MSFRYTQRKNVFTGRIFKNVKEVIAKQRIASCKIYTSFLRPLVSRKSSIIALQSDSESSLFSQIRKKESHTYSNVCIFDRILPLCAIEEKRLLVRFLSQ